VKEYPEDKSDHDLVEEAKSTIARRNGRTELNAVYTSHLWEDLCILFHELKEKEKSDRTARLHKCRMKAIRDIDPEEISRYLDKIDRLKNSGISRVQKHLAINAPDQESLDKWFIRFFKWEADVEDRAYASGTIKVSNFFSALDDLVRKEGEDKSNEYHEDFLSTAFLWRGYLFKLYCGQGCFTRIYKGENQVFQTT